MTEKLNKALKAFNRVHNAQKALDTAERLLESACIGLTQNEIGEFAVRTNEIITVADDRAMAFMERAN